MTSWTSNWAGIHPKNDPVGKFQLNFHQWKKYFQQKQNFMWHHDKVKSFSVRKLKKFCMISSPTWELFRLGSLLLVLSSVLLTHGTSHHEGGESQDLQNDSRFLDHHISLTAYPVKKKLYLHFFGGFSKGSWPASIWTAAMISHSFLRHKWKISKKLIGLGLEALIWMWDGEEFSFLNLESFKSLRQLLNK